MTRAQPNFVLIMPDQQRWDSLRCYGNTFVETPNLDRLAAEGTTFTHAFTPWPVCTPARATMWTGVYPSTHRVIENVYGIEDVLTAAPGVGATLFALLRSVGYETAHFGKWHLGERQPQFFDVWMESFNSRVSHWVESKIGGDYRPNVQTDRCIEYLHSRVRSSQPFAVVQGYYPPHDPFTAPQRFYEPYRGRGVPNAGYYAAVSAIDYDMGRILDALDSTGLRQRTIVIYFSDHGETFFYRPEGEHKFVCFEEAIRIPFLMSCPGRIPSGARLPCMVGLQDLMPTILDYAGAAMPAGLHGMSLKPLCEGQLEEGRAAYYVQNITFRSALEQRCLRTTEWKLIGSAGGAHSLFNLISDPEEEFDLFDTPHGERGLGEYRHFPDHAEIIRSLAAWMQEVASDIGDHRGVQIAAEVLNSVATRGRLALRSRGVL